MLIYKINNDNLTSYYLGNEKREYKSLQPLNIDPLLNGMNDKFTYLFSISSYKCVNEYSIVYKGILVITCKKYYT